MKDHVLLPYASDLDEVDREFKKILSTETIENIVSIVPEEWLLNEPAFPFANDHRQAYIEFLETRIAHSEIFVNKAKDAREKII